MKLDTARQAPVFHSPGGAGPAAPSSASKPVGQRLLHAVTHCKAAVGKLAGRPAACVKMLPRILLCCSPSAKGTEARAQMRVWRDGREQKATFSTAMKMTLETSAAGGAEEAVRQAWMLAALATSKVKTKYPDFSPLGQRTSADAAVPALSKYRLGQLVVLRDRLANLVDIGQRPGQAGYSVATRLMKTSLQGVEAEISHRQNAFQELLAEHFGRCAAQARVAATGEAEPAAATSQTDLLARTVALVQERGKHESMKQYLNGVADFMAPHDVYALAGAYTQASATGAIKSLKVQKQIDAVAGCLVDIAKQRAIREARTVYSQHVNAGIDAGRSREAILEQLIQAATEIVSDNDASAVLAVDMHTAALGRRAPPAPGYLS